ncbi:MAG: hypothetical protein FJ308_22440 [Planctomycetes bacterium]|nr:hypothetical protein [Planctomycetota bacterium]
MQFADIEISLNGDDDTPRQLFDEAGLLTTDIFIYNGDIHPALYRVFRQHIGHSSFKKALLLLTTPGGDADAAYRIARNFQESYEQFTVAVWGHCKSAGTLLAIGATELVIEQCGELGPLDVQIFRPDEFIRRSSGLSVTQALEFITKKAFDLWEESFLQVRQRSGGLITTKTASEIASQLAIGLFSPITEKIDPTWVGELQRSVDVAFHYGLRLGMSPDALNALIQGFPSHSFVIDFRDAKKLFKSVRRPSDGERFLFQNVLQSSSKEFPGDFLQDYIKEDLLMRLTISVASTPDQEVKGTNENHNQENSTTPRRRRSRANASAKDGGSQDEKEDKAQ